MLKNIGTPSLKSLEFRIRVGIVKFPPGSIVSELIRVLNWHSFYNSPLIRFEILPYLNTQSDKEEENKSVPI